MGSNDSAETDQTANSRVHNPEFKKIAIPINVNDAITAAIITDSPGTVLVNK